MPDRMEDKEMASAKGESREESHLPGNNQEQHLSGTKL